MAAKSDFVHVEYGTAIEAANMGYRIASMGYSGRTIAISNEVVKLKCKLLEGNLIFRKYWEHRLEKWQKLLYESMAADDDANKLFCEQLPKVKPIKVGELIQEAIKRMNNERN